MIKIRLARGGAKKRPYYSIVVADSHSPRDGRFIEKVGAYDPLLAKDNPDRVTLKVERTQEWLAKGTQTTDRGAREAAAEEAPAEAAAEEPAAEAAAEEAPAAEAGEEPTEG